MNEKFELIDLNAKIIFSNRIIKKYIKKTINKFIKESRKKFYVQERFINEIKALIKRFNLYNTSHKILNNQRGYDYNWQKLICHNLNPLTAKDLLMDKTYAKKKYKEYINALISNSINFK
ncbi:hypothetical protein BHY_0254 [Borrelia nietonii YOR]|uniref:Uncharacterized protein n=1 Tax=Borrelia nietonii YOR TaxID=1293576 RepID=A0ABM5PGT3_9SPIR|nr:MULTISPECIES: hypothetical protein [Borrelia]AHH03205.1 hypothetical protein BHY_0254 [Borrelia nietonii YOR]AHH13736.1 hypothetical protein BHW_0091400 [Borrelia hermsii MTW]UPA08961.1 hypothetical protein bhYOR_000234 [Borrelia nietonii YOR]